LPGLQDLRVYDLREQVWRASRSASASGPAPFQSVEGLSIGVDVAAHYALDPARVGTIARDLPADVAADVVAPAVQGVIYRVFTRYTVREIFSSKRAEIQQVIETELRPRLAADGIVLRGVQIGKVDLPADYRRGMEALLAEELESEKMRFTLELKDKQVRQAELEAEADKVRREKAAEAAGAEQIIAAKAQEEAMAHVLPFKQKQIQQRALEAEADKTSRIKTAEGAAEARRIEAAGEADSRNRLADAEVYRLDKVGLATSEQMAREGALITRHPLLIQKTMADKLSDKIQVIIAPPPAGGGFIGSALLGTGRATPVAATDDASQEKAQ
jgi:regulator of protease activity HflC (stomatin/prohibitin superfamily)